MSFTDTVVLDRQTFNEIRAIAGGRENAEAIVTRIVTLFEEDTARLLGELVQAVADEDAGQAGYIAHAIRSAAGFIGARRLAACAEAFEYASTSEPGAALRERAQQLLETFAELRAVLGPALAELTR